MAVNTDLESQIRECFGRVVYTHKCHMKMADRFADRMNRFKLTQIVLTALTSSGAIGVIFLDEILLKIATAAVSCLSLFVSTYLKNFDPGGIAQMHRDAGAEIWDVRESYFSLLTDLGNMQPEDVARRRDELQHELNAIYKAAPQTDGKAYKAAQAALKYNEELTFTDKEIDCFLPESLRKGAD